MCLSLLVSAEKGNTVVYRLYILSNSLCYSIIFSLYTLYAGPNLNRIVKILLEVKGWEILANEIKFSQGDINKINVNCNKAAECCRSELVVKYCNSEGLDVVSVAHKIADALESECVGHKRQANELRKLFPTNTLTTAKSSSGTFLIVVLPTHTCMRFCLVWNYTLLYAPYIEVGQI